MFKYEFLVVNVHFNQTRMYVWARSVYIVLRQICPGVCPCLCSFFSDPETLIKIKVRKFRQIDMHPC